MKTNNELLEGLYDALYEEWDGGKPDMLILAEAALEYMSANQWRDIESAPDDKELLLGWWYIGAPEPVFRYEVSKFSWGYDNGFGNSRGQHGRAEYWMPLPTPPILKQESE